MLVENAKLDLCSTCIDITHCVPNSRRPVFFCEQFNDFVPKKKNKINPAPKVTTIIDEMKTSSNFKFLGLCINCDFREECPHAKKEGGVWHCEEYR